MYWQSLQVVLPILWVRMNQPPKLPARPRQHGVTKRLRTCVSEFSKDAAVCHSLFSEDVCTVADRKGETSSQPDEEQSFLAEVWSGSSVCDFTVLDHDRAGTFINLDLELQQTLALHAKRL